MIITLVISFLSISYALYSWVSPTNTTANIELEGVEVLYDGGANISGFNLLPVLTKQDGITKSIVVRAKKETTLAITMNLYLKINNLGSGLKDSAFKWSLEKNNVEISSSNFANASVNDVIALTTLQNVTTVEDKYKLYIWIDGSEDNYSSITNQAFSFEVYASGTNASDVNTSISTTGTSSVLLSNSVGMPLSNYQINGNSVQNTPISPSTPSAINSLGDDGSIDIITTSTNLYNYLDFTNTNTTYWKANQNVIVSQEVDGYKVLYNQTTSTPGLIWSAPPHTFEVGKTYTVTVRMKGIGLNSVSGYFFDGNNVLNFPVSSTEFVTVSSSFTFSGYTQNFILFYNSAPSLSTGFIIQWMDIREGNTGVTDYEPYYNETITIPLDEPLRKVGSVSDYIDYGNGKIVRNIGVKTYYGTEHWGNYVPYNGNELTTFSVQSSVGATTNVNTPLLCNMFESVNSVWSSSNNSNGIATSSNTFYMKIDRTLLNLTLPSTYNSQTGYDSIGGVADAWKRFLVDKNNAGTPLIVYYQLTNPVIKDVILPTINIPEGTVNLTVSDGVISASNINVFYQTK